MEDEEAGDGEVSPPWGDLHGSAAHAARPELSIVEEAEAEASPVAAEEGMGLLTDVEPVGAGESWDKKGKKRGYTKKQQEQNNKRAQLSRKKGKEAMQKLREKIDLAEDATNYEIADAAYKKIEQLEDVVEHLSVHGGRAQSPLPPADPDPDDAT